MRTGYLCLMLALAGCGVSTTTYPTDPYATNTPTALLVAFDYGSATLSPTAQHQIDNAVALFHSANDQVALVVVGASAQNGHDNDGYYNTYRAEAVKSAVIARGVPPAQVIVRGYVYYDDDTMNANDRYHRIVITW